MFQERSGFLVRLVVENQLNAHRLGVLHDAQSLNADFLLGVFLRACRLDLFKLRDALLDAPDFRAVV